MIVRARTLLAVITLPALVAACGDDLESRQAAIDAQGGDRQRGTELTIERPQGAPAARDAIPDRTADFDEADDAEDGRIPIPRRPGDESDDGDAGDEDVVVDAAPDDLIDSAQGFAPVPMDDASGIDPSPVAPETFDD